MGDADKQRQVRVARGDGTHHLRSFEVLSVFCHNVNTEPLLEYLLTGGAEVDRRGDVPVHWWHSAQDGFGHLSRADESDLPRLRAREQRSAGQRQTESAAGLAQSELTMGSSRSASVIADDAALSSRRTALPCTARRWA